MYPCIVPGCTSYGDDYTKEDAFRFPKDEVRRNQWIRNIPGGDKIKPDLSRVCIRHFSEKFIITEGHAKTATRPDGTIRGFSSHRFKLSEDAVPTIFDEVLLQNAPESMGFHMDDEGQEHEQMSGNESVISEIISLSSSGSRSNLSNQSTVEVEVHYKTDHNISTENNGKDDSSPSAQPSPWKRRKKTERQETLNILATSIQSSATSRFTTFGQHIAQELSELTPSMAIYCKKMINDAIFQAQVGNLTMYSKIVNPEPTVNGNQVSSFQYPARSSVEQFFSTD